MAVPEVTCGSNILVAYDAGDRTISLSATASGSPTSWRWDILHVPPGSTADVGSKGDFVDGVALVQNPQIVIDGAVDGGYCFQARATNLDGPSDPTVDKQNAQQLIIVKTEKLAIYLPPDFAFLWGENYVNPSLRLLEQKIGSWGEDKFTATAGQTVFALSAEPLDDDAVLMIVDKAVYEKDLDFTVTGQTVTWLDHEFALEAGDEIVFKYPR